MIDNQAKTILVGDNPFLGISHLSQDKARSRVDEITGAEYAARLVNISLENGANGFLFSSCDTNLSILRVLKQNGPDSGLALYAIMPYTFEYVRWAVLHGGITGLARKVGTQVVLSGNIRAITNGLQGFIRTDPGSLLKAYLSFEVSRIRSAAGKKAHLNSILLHEVLTDMSLGLDMQWIFETHLQFTKSIGIQPGINTRNLPLLVKKFQEWNLDLDGVFIACPFNAIGFQMSPSKEECERVLAQVPQAHVIAISLLAAGYIKLNEAVEYATSLPDLKGAVVGVSKEEQAVNTFTFLNDKFRNRAI